MSDCEPSTSTSGSKMLLITIDRAIVRRYRTIVGYRSTTACMLAVIDITVDVGGMSAIVVVAICVSVMLCITTTELTTINCEILSAREEGIRHRGRRTGRK